MQFLREKEYLSPETIKYREEKLIPNFWVETSSAHEKSGPKAGRVWMRKWVPKVPQPAVMVTGKANVHYFMTWLDRYLIRDDKLRFTRTRRTKPKKIVVPDHVAFPRETHQPMRVTQVSSTQPQSRCVNLR